MFLNKKSPPVFIPSGAKSFSLVYSLLISKIILPTECLADFISRLLN
jgi:hypothetical protein